MSPLKDGGPAFPQHRSHKDGWSDATGGMTLRDYFAAKAMQGLCGNEDWINKAAKNTGAPLWTCAFGAYEMADAMLKAREVQP